MTGAEIVVKQGHQYGYFKFRHDGYFVEDYLLGDQPNLKQQTLQQVLDQILNTFMATYGDPAYEIETFYRQGFVTQLTKNFNFYELNLVAELNSVNEAIESALRAELKVKGLAEDQEDLFVGYGDYQVYLDLDDQRIYGLVDEEGEPAVYNFDYQVVETNREG
jgi:hypothetical protein